MGIPLWKILRILLSVPIWRLLYSKKWIRHCYRQGDVVITPTEYSRELLMKYDLHREIYALTNGVDTEFFHKTEQAGGRFRIFFSSSCG
ncbi:glycosyltransferase [Waltera sp.]|uniref:glycosyltransferase n=1 Tax=Waltera sp. TaxID=2815806 RepID=UPI0039A06622